MVEAFAAVLGAASSASSMSVESSFFELGGNSLRAVSLARRLSASLGREVSVADVMRSPTAAALGAHGTADADGECSLRLPLLVRALDGARLLAMPHAVSWNQSQLLTVHVVDGATAAYNIPMAHWLRRGGDGGDASAVTSVVSLSLIHI